MNDDTFTYRLTVLAQPDEDGAVHPDAQGGSCRIELPFEADEEALLSVALEEIGVFDSSSYSIETTDSAGFCVRDAEGEAVITLELEDDSIVDDEPYDDFLAEPVEDF